MDVSSRTAVRDLVVAILVGTGAAAGLLMGTLPWRMAMFCGALIAAGLLVGDILVFGRPQQRSTPEGRRSLAVLGVVIVLAGLTVSFELGRLVEASREDQVYAYIANGGDGTAIGIYSLPVETALHDITFPGDLVHVDCRVDYKDGSWLRLSPEQGWIKVTEFYREPHTGKGTPPSCPEE